MTDISGYSISRYEYQFSNVPCKKERHKRAALYSVRQLVIFEDISNNDIWLSTPNEKAKIINSSTTKPVPCVRIHNVSKNTVICDMQTATVSQVETTSKTLMKCLPLVIPATVAPQKCNVTEALKTDNASCDQVLSFKSTEVCEPFTARTSDYLDFSHLECCATETTMETLESFGTVQPMPTDMPFAEVGENGVLLDTRSVYESSIAMGLYMGPLDNLLVSDSVKISSDRTFDIAPTQLDHILTSVQTFLQLRVLVFHGAEALPSLIFTDVHPHTYSWSTTQSYLYWAEAQPLISVYFQPIAIVLITCVLRLILIKTFAHTCVEGGGYHHWA